MSLLMLRSCPQGNVSGVDGYNFKGICEQEYSFTLTDLLRVMQGMLSRRNTLPVFVPAVILLSVKCFRVLYSYYAMPCQIARSIFIGFVNATLLAGVAILSQQEVRRPAESCVLLLAFSTPLVWKALCGCPQYSYHQSVFSDQMFVLVIYGVCTHYASMSVIESF